MQGGSSNIVKIYYPKYSRADETLRLSSMGWIWKGRATLYMDRKHMVDVFELIGLMCTSVA